MSCSVSFKAKSTPSWCNELSTHHHSSNTQVLDQPLQDRLGEILKGKGLLLRLRTLQSCKSAENRPEAPKERTLEMRGM